MTSVPGRWSAHPEPLRHVRDEISERERLEIEAKSRWTLAERYIAQYDPSLDPREHDVAAAEEGEEVAVAVLTAHGAYAWGTKSYAHDNWAKPEWKLEHGTYKVVVRVAGSSVSNSASFKLEYLDSDLQSSGCRLRRRGRLPPSRIAQREVGAGRAPSLCPRSEGESGFDSRVEPEAPRSS